MSGGALFSGGRGGSAGTGSRALVEFRAGKMNLDASSKMVTPDKRKGLIQVEQGEEDHLMHFKWKDRSNGNTLEDDLIIFPDDIEFKAVPQCTTGRVFIMKFKSSPGRNMFFWMQEPKEDKDEEYCKKVNDLLNNPPAPGSAAARGGSGGGGGLSGNGLDLSNLGESDLQSLLSNMSQQQLMQLFGGSLSGPGGLLSSGGGGSRRQRSSAAASSTLAASETRSEATRTTTAAATSAATTTTTTAAASTPSAATTSASATSNRSTNPPIQLMDLQNLLSGLNVPPEAAEEGSSRSGPAVDLASGLTAEVMQPLLSNPDFVKKMKTFLPAEDQASQNIQDEIKGTVNSPQFQQALSLFSSAFQSAQLAPLIREFDLGTEAVEAATKGDLETFVKALQKSAPKKKKDDAPEDMALD